MKNQTLQFKVSMLRSSAFWEWKLHWENSKIAQYQRNCLKQFQKDLHQIWFICNVLLSLLNSLFCPFFFNRNRLLMYGTDIVFHISKEPVCMFVYSWTHRNGTPVRVGSHNCKSSCMIFFSFKHVKEEICNE